MLYIDGNNRRFPVNIGHSVRGVLARIYRRLVSSDDRFAGFGANRFLRNRVFAYVQRRHSYENLSPVRFARLC